MGKKLYVGNLSFDATEDEVRKAFSACGDVASVSIVTDRMTGRSRGFAFVEMATDDAALRAVEQVNGLTVGARPLRVSEAVERPRTGGGGGRGGYGAGGGGGGYDGGGGGGGYDGGPKGERGGKEGGGRRDRGRW